MPDLLNLGSLATAFLVVLVSSIGYFVTKLYSRRRIVWELQRKGLPVAPGHNFLFGHLLYLKTAMDALPKGAHFQYAIGGIAQENFTKEGVYYIDLWPMSGLLLVVIAPNVTTQATLTNTDLSMERPSIVHQIFKPITGGPALFDLPEKEWKPLRMIFNKGFSNDYTLSLVPGMIEETKVFYETLRSMAERKELFYLDPTTSRLTMDLIGRTILNASLGAQKGYNVLADSMLSQIRWQQPNSGTNFLEFFNCARRYVHWRNGRRMDRYIGEELDKRYDEHRTQSTRKKAVMDLVLQAYTSEDDTEMPNKLDPEFRAFAIRNIRLFLFVGYDSTGSTICYIFHLLSKHVDVLAKVRAEHDSVFGTNQSSISSILENQPHLLNSLPYTTAVIKEALRIFSPASCSRAGKPNVDVIDDAGNVCPTDHSMIWTIHTEVHRSPKYWKRPDDFLPERFLVEPGHELYPMKGAWRPFEHGPRNCIAQGLVMTELKVILAFIVRDFDVKPAYDEWDRLYSTEKTSKTYKGERAYQIEEGSAHPVDRYPCRASFRMP